MKVKALYQYPVKSLGGQSRRWIEPLGRGFRDDRRWMFTDARGSFISQRGNVQLSTFSAEIEGDTLTFRSAETDEIVGAVAGARSGKKGTVTVWDDTFQATEIHSDALFDLTRKLGIADARLFYMGDDDVRPVDQRYAKKGEQVSFADGYPYLITTTGSLKEIASELCIPNLDERRFRPNIIVDTPRPWLEDDWTSLNIGGHRFRLPKPCARCVMVTHQPGTGERDLALLATLTSLRRREGKILFGMNACWEGGRGVISCGDLVVSPEL